MTIREVLEADWAVSVIDVTVRDKDARYIMEYVIGRDVKSGRSEQFLEETELGDVYKNCGARKLYMNRIIQHKQLTDAPPSKSGLYGVLLDKIPKELLDLEVYYMSPSNLGTSDNFHEYRFDCQVDYWDGITGEQRQLKLDL